MDTTPEYIKQCKGAFTCIGFIDAGELTNLFFDDDSYWHGFSPDGRNDKPLGQLYRQDQLQEMLHCSIGEGMNRLWAYFHEWFCKIGAVEYSKSSWEQLWLAFVMKEKYGKVWNGEEWEVDH